MRRRVAVVVAVLACSVGLGVAPAAAHAALVASNPRIANAYRAFRREHIDRFNRKEKLIGTLLATGALGLLGAVALLGYE